MTLRQRFILVISIVAAFIFLTGPVCGGPQKPFSVSIEDIEVSKPPGQTRLWDQPTNFDWIKTPSVCYLEYTVATYHSLPAPGQGICTELDYSFNLADWAHSLSDNQCIFGISRSIDEEKCYATLRASCLKPFSSAESLPPARIFAQDDTPEGVYPIFFEPIGGSGVIWKDCPTLTEKSNGKSVPGNVTIVFE